MCALARPPLGPSPTRLGVEFAGLQVVEQLGVRRHLVRFRVRVRVRVRARARVRVRAR